MNYAAKFAALTRRGQNLMDYTLQFCHLAVRSPFDDETIKTLYWIGANYKHQVDLPDMQGLSWRDAILENVWRGSTPGPSHHRT